MQDIKDVFHFVVDYFKGDYEKTLMWFYIPNPNLGGVSPMWMVMHGRTEKLVKFVKCAKEGIWP